MGGAQYSQNKAATLAIMEATLYAFVEWLLITLALPEVGLPAVFLVCLVSATLLPMGSEPVVFGYVTLMPTMFWPTILVATLGNTLGGMISYAMGLVAKKAAQRWRVSHGRSRRAWARAVRRWGIVTRRWLRRYGAPVLLLSWLPAVGDPLCALAGWSRLPFWPCVAYMAIGKLGRYWVMTTALVWTVS